jgi:hypothetical protein
LQHLLGMRQPRRCPMAADQQTRLRLIRWGMGFDMWELTHDRALMLARKCT